MRSGRAVSRAGIGGALACLLLLTDAPAALGLTEARIGPVDLLSRALVVPALFAFLVVGVLGRFKERAEGAPPR